MARAAGLTGPCLPQEASAHICANGWIRVIWSTDAPPIATETKRPLCTAYPGTGRADRRQGDHATRAGGSRKAIVPTAALGRPSLGDTRSAAALMAATSAAHPCGPTSVLAGKRAPRNPRARQVDKASR